jgi:hypothetical protein
MSAWDMLGGDISIVNISGHGGYESVPPARGDCRDMCVAL